MTSVHETTDLPFAAFLRVLRVQLGMRTDGDRMTWTSDEDLRGYQQRFLMGEEVSAVDYADALRRLKELANAGK